MAKLFSVVASGLAAISLGLSGCAAFDQSKQSTQADNPAASSELQIKPILQTSTGLSGKSFTYPDGEAELRLLRVEFPEGGSVPLHTHPAPLIAYVSQGQIRHTRGDEVNTFGPGEAFVESDQGGVWLLRLLHLLIDPFLAGAEELPYIVVDECSSLNHNLNCGKTT